MPKITPTDSFRGAQDGVTVEEFEKGKTYDVTAAFAHQCIEDGLAKDGEKRSGKKDQGPAPENKDLGGPAENK